MPNRNRARINIIIVKVLWALRTVGLRKRGTALLTASTPVNAVQPLAKAAKSIQTLRVPVIGGSLGGATTTWGWPPLCQTLSSPITMATAIHPINMITGTMKAWPDSRMPRRLIKVSVIKTKRQSGRVYGCSVGKAETTAPIPAEMPTQTFSR